MPVETPSIFSKIIEEHLELKRRNAELERNLPLSRYVNDDPFQNHPLFKTEEQARLEETMDGTEPALAPIAPALAPTADGTDLAEAVEPEEALQAWSEAAEAEAPAVAPASVYEDEGLWGRSRDFDWGD
jgi:hypothetical protein